MTEIKTDRTTKKRTMSIKRNYKITDYGAGSHINNSKNRLIKDIAKILQKIQSLENYFTE